MLVRGSRALCAALVVTCVASSAPRAFAAGPSKAECIAANEEAQDLRRGGRLRAARARLAQCVDASCPGPVREDCSQAIAEVDAAMPTLVFEVRDAAGNDVSGARVSLGGDESPVPVTGTALSVDPGAHHFVFEADGVPTTEKDVVVHEGDKGRHIRVTMGAPAANAAAAPAVSAKPAVGPEDKPAGGSTMRTLGLVTGGVGVVGLAVGTIFGVLTKSTYDKALQDECGNKVNGCTAQGSQDGKTAHTDAAVSTGAFIGGGVFLVAGALLFFTAPKDNVVVAPAASASGGGLLVRGTW
jgi:hypothetical protein